MRDPQIALARKWACMSAHRPRPAAGRAPAPAGLPYRRCSSPSRPERAPERSRISSSATASARGTGMTPSRTAASRSPISRSSSILKAAATRGGMRMRRSAPISQQGLDARPARPGAARPAAAPPRRSASPARTAPPRRINEYIDVAQRLPSTTRRRASPTGCGLHGACAAPAEYRRPGARRPDKAAEENFPLRLPHRPPAPPPNPKEG